MLMFWERYRAKCKHEGAVKKQTTALNSADVCTYRADTVEMFPPFWLLYESYMCYILYEVYTVISSDPPPSSVTEVAIVVVSSVLTDQKS